jgi:hypothetical protein
MVARAEVSAPFLGDWQGQGLVAQVIPRGANRYEVKLLPEFDIGCEPLAVLAAAAANGELRFDQGGWTGRAKEGVLVGSRVVDGEPVAFELQHVIRQSPRVGAKPPDNAVVLFDGSGFERWEVQGRRPSSDRIVWQLHGGAMRVTPADRASRAGHSLVTKQAFQDFRLHLEFRLPLMAEQTGQARANGGIAFEDPNWYELQILDSYGLEGLDNECGGIYKVAAPTVNMCRPPLMWQSYDIEYHAPRYDQQGNRVRAGRISVNHNGRDIHTDVELPDSERAQRRRQDNPDSIRTGRIILHYHKDPIEYRNIWLQEL